MAAAGQEQTVSDYIVHHLTNLTYGKLPEGFYAAAEKEADRGRGHRAAGFLRIIGFRRKVFQAQNIAKENVHAFMRESADGSIIARRIPSEVEIAFLLQRSRPLPQYSSH